MSSWAVGTLEVAMMGCVVVSLTGLERCDGKGKTTKVLACSANVDVKETGNTRTKRDAKIRSKLKYGFTILVSL